MTATALPSQRTAVRSRGGALGTVKKLFFPVAPTYLFMIIPVIVLFTFFIIYPAVVGTIVTNVTAMALAIALNSKIKWRAGFRTVFFMPMVISGLIISYVFTF